MRYRYAQTINFQATKERINPNQTATFAKFPNWLMRRKELSPGAKILYCRAAQYAGNKNYARVKQETLCLETGFCVRQVRDYIKELEHFGLIEIQQIGLNKCNIYYFLDHPWMYEEKKPTQSKQPYPVVTTQDTRFSERQDVAGQDRQHPAAQDRQDLAGQDRSDLAAPLNRSSEKIPLKEHTQKRESECVSSSEVSAYNTKQWEDYANAQKGVHSPKALARHLAKSKDNDHLMKEFLDTQEQEKQNESKRALEAQEQALSLEREKYILVKQILALGEPLYPWQVQFVQDNKHLLSNQLVC